MTPILSRRMAAMLVTLPCTAGRMCFVCQGVVCAVMSVKYISQLGNVGKLTPVQCLTNHIIKNVLAHTFKKKKKEKKTLSPISKQQSIHFKQACFITTIIIKYKPTWSINYQKQTENTLLQHIFQGCLVVMLTTFTTTAPLVPSS